MTAAETPAARGQACPYLGLIDDSATHLAYPSTAQVCHALGRPSAADHVKQAQDCLTAEHVRCPRYHPVTEPAPAGRMLRDALAGSETAGASTPTSTTSITPTTSTTPATSVLTAAPATRVRPQAPPRRPFRPRRVAGLALFVILLAAVALGGLFIGSQLADQMGGSPGTGVPVGGTSTATPSITITPAPATATPAVLPTATTVPTPTPTAAITPTPAPTPTPVRTQTTHVVKLGETLTQIAQQYGVTVLALQTANNLADPNIILTGQTLVIPAP